jgi:hypothetical protein
LNEERGAATAEKDPRLTVLLWWWWGGALENLLSTINWERLLVTSGVNEEKSAERGTGRMILAARGLMCCWPLLSVSV